MVYMAPELLDQLKLQGMSEGVPIDGKQCDVYATAMLYSEILQPHTLPMSHFQAAAMLVAVIRDNYRPLLPEVGPRCPKRLVDLIEAAGNHQKSQRKAIGFLFYAI